MIRRYTGYLLAAFAIGASGIVVPGAEAQDRATGLSAIDLFALADRARAAGRLDDAYALYDALARDPDADVRAEARFRKAMLLAEHKRYADAAVLFRALLDEKPDAVRARLELARVLALMGNEDAARRALRQARAAGLPADVSATVNQFARALRSSRPFGGSFELAIAPDSNINRATQARTLDTIIAPLTLSRDARARSGLGVKVAGSAFARVPLSDTLSLLPRLAGLGMIYRDAAFNDVSGSALIGLEWRLGADRVSPSIGRTFRWYGGRRYADGDTAALDWIHPIGPRAQLVASGSAARTRYRLNPLQDGGLYDLRLSYERAMTPKAGLSLAIAASRQSAADPGYATWSGGVTALGWRELGRSTIYASMDVRRLEGDARLFLFTDRRREWFASARLGATLRQFTVHGFAPVIRLGVERNRSTVGLYDYRRAFAEAGITRAF